MIKFQNSDAWLLASIIDGGQRNGADIRSIISSGDYLNHAIFNFEELYDGLRRLIAEGFIKEKKGKFYGTKKINEIKIKHKSPYNIIKEIEIFFQKKNTELNSININNVKLKFDKKMYKQAIM